MVVLAGGCTAKTGRLPRSWARASPVHMAGRAFLRARRLVLRWNEGLTIADGVAALYATLAIAGRRMACCGHDAEQTYDANPGRSHPSPRSRVALYFTRGDTPQRR